MTELERDFEKTEKVWRTYKPLYIIVETLMFIAIISCIAGVVYMLFKL